MIFDRIAILDWSAANRPRLGKDSIWLGHDSAPPENLPTRAAGINSGLPGLGPFWFNPTKTDLPGLPRKGTARHGHGFADLRVTDRAKGAQSVWKLGGAGAVGSQVLTGLPVLWRLRAAFPGRVAAWPFEPAAPVTLAEVFPSLLAGPVRAATTARAVRDAVQVTLLARALATLDRQGALAALLAPPPAPRDEGWILGLGAEPALCAACAPSLC